MIEYFNKLTTKSYNEFTQELKQSLINNEKKFIVTANPEIFITANNDVEVKKLLVDKNTTIVPDGISIVKAARMLGFRVKERIPGVDISNYLISEGNKQNKSIYLFGASEEVISVLVDKISEKYTSLNIVGKTNGYVTDKDKVFEEIVQLQPDIILVALGVPQQEQLIYKYLDKFDKGLFVGVGGTFDVLSGTKKRAPSIVTKLNLEWLYRITKEPKRIKRFCNYNVKFVNDVTKIKVLKKHNLD